MSEHVKPVGRVCCEVLSFIGLERSHVKGKQEVTSTKSPQEEPGI